MERLQEEWLLINNPKVLKAIYVVETPLLNQMFSNRRTELCDSDRTIYQRKYIEQVRGKCCSMCSTTLSGDNTWVIYKSFPRKYYEEVYCTRCSTLSAVDKHSIRKMGYHTFKEVNAIKVRIEKLSYQLTEWKEERELVKLYHHYHVRTNYTSGTVERNIKELKTLIDQFRNQIKVLVKGASPKEVKYEVDYSDIVPFRSEEDFDF